MERRSRVTITGDSSDEINETDHNFTDKELEDFRKNELKNQFNSVRSREIPKQSASELHAYTTAKKIVKLCTMIVVFLVLLASTVVSKVSYRSNADIHTLRMLFLGSHISDG